MGGNTVLVLFYFLSFCAVNIFVVQSQSLICQKPENVTVPSMTTEESDIEFCVRPENVTGHCMVIQDCPPIYKLLENKPLSEDIEHYLRGVLCGFVGIIPKVCCAIPEEIRSESGLASKYRADLDYRCGMQHADDFPHESNQPLIVEFPWIARLRFKTDPDNYEESFCTGALISPRHILTAAQCLFEDVKLTTVRLGEYHMHNETDCIYYSTIDAEECSTFQDISVKSYIRHPDFDCTIDGSHNIGLITLASDVKYTDYIRPICIPGPETPKAEIGETLSVSGWGWRVELTAFEVLKSKQKRTITINPNSTCEDSKIKVEEDQRCASYLNDGNNLCLYDNGGPVMISLDRRWYAEGIILTSEKNCISETSSLVYLKVADYADWIKKNMHF